MANDLQLFTGDDDEKLPVAPGLGAMPALVLSSGEHGTYRFLEFFAAHIRNPNTRAAYFRDVCAFFLWCQRRKIHALSRSARIMWPATWSGSATPMRPLGQAAPGRDPDAI